MKEAPSVSTGPLYINKNKEVIKMLNSELFFKSQALGKDYFSILDRAWNRIPKSKQKEIEELIASLKSDGAICTVHDFVKGAS